MLASPQVSQGAKHEYPCLTLVSAHVTALAGASARWFESPISDALALLFARVDACRPSLQIAFHSWNLLGDDRLAVVN